MKNRPECPHGLVQPECLSDFHQQVLAELAELKTQVRALLGDGQPGRISNLESRVERHEAYVQRAIGIGALFGGLLTLLNFALEYLKLPR